jgi:Undecaprenyl-phosphate glucose phosphotransferase
MCALLLFYSVALALDTGDKFLPVQTMLFAGSGVVLLVLGRLLACRIFRRLSQRGVIGRSMAVLGVGEQSRRFLQRLAATKPYFVSVVGVFADEPDSAGGLFLDKPVLGDTEALVAFARGQKIDDIVIAMPWNADRKLTALVETLKELPVNVHLSTDLAGFELAFRPVLGNLTELPMFEVVQRPISGWSSALKMLEDYILGTAILVLVSPILILIALAIKIDSPGPVFFMQKRLGFNNKEFAIYKFRSMYHQQAPETVVRQASRRDPRVTRVGRLIRATSLDELPQLLNVLNGTMSIVGPRPHALSHNEEYGRRIRGYFARHRVKPGITGWAQVNGLRGETETLDKMEARIRHDIYYAENWSILFDVRILITTVLVVLFQRTAY